MCLILGDNSVFQCIDYSSSQDHTECFTFHQKWWFFWITIRSESCSCRISSKISLHRSFYSGMINPRYDLCITFLHVVILTQNFPYSVYFNVFGFNYYMDSEVVYSQKIWLIFSSDHEVEGRIVCLLFFMLWHPSYMQLHKTSILPHKHQ